jgi:thymidylate synthase ThyX
MTISAKLLLDSVTTTGKRITTWELKYPRFIHSEFMTHRVFSRNAASSRAIPFKKIVSNIMNDMASPVHWGANQSGMQAKVELSPFKKFLAQSVWKLSGYTAIGLAYLLYWTGVHKQIVNRVIEPWSHITVIMTATDMDNFFELRAHPDAQPEFQELAYKMNDIVISSEPRQLYADEWHLPFIREYDYYAVTDHLVATGIWEAENSNNSNNLEIVKRNSYHLIEMVKRISAARCARVSYLTHDGNRPTIQDDLKLFDRLIVSKPMHASPVEHQVRSLLDNEVDNLGGNLGSGVVQFRKELEQRIVH